MPCHFETINHWVVIRFAHPRLTDERTLSEIEIRIDEEMDGLPLRGQVCVDFRGVEFASSQLIGLLMSIKHHVTRQHGTVMLCNLGPQVTEILRITKLYRQFQSKPTLEDVTGPRRSNTWKTNSELVWMD